MESPIRSGPNSSKDDQTVASVGPYALKKRRPLPHRSARSSGHSSPATIIRDSAGKGSSDMALNAEGGRVAIVIPPLRKEAASETPGSIASLGASQMLAPDASDITISKTNASKLGDE